MRETGLKLADGDCFNVKKFTSLVYMKKEIIAGRGDQ